MLPCWGHGRTATPDCCAIAPLCSGARIFCPTAPQLWFILPDERRTQVPHPLHPRQAPPRHDGWTADKQVAFIEALAETACVDAACKRVGVTRQSAYRLRRRECGAAFRAAWDNALDHALHQLEEAALDRALHGVPRPIFYKGEQVGEWREFDERLTMFLLRSRRPQRFGKWIERMLAPEPDQGEPAWRLSGDLDYIELTAPEENGYEDEAE